MATPISDADLRAVAERCNWSPAAVSRALGRGAKPPGSLGVRLRALRLEGDRASGEGREGGRAPEAQEGAEEAAPSEGDILREQVRQLHLEVTGLRRRSVTDELVRREILKLANAPVRVPDWVVSRSEAPVGTPGVPTLFSSDQHFGEVVDPAQIGGVNFYNIEEARIRWRRMTERTIDLCFNHVVNPRYPGMVFAAGGDGVSGDIHDELSSTNDKPIMPCVLELASLYAWSIREFRRAFGKVMFVGVIGNHGRNTEKPRHKDAACTSFDWLAYSIAQKMLEGERDVQFLIPTSTDALFRIYNHRYLLTHGNQFKVGDSIIGPIGGVARGDQKKRARNSSVGQGYDTLMLGHFHQLRMDPRIIMNGSLKGYCEYANGNNFPVERPQQALWLTHPENGPTISFPVFVDEGRPSAETGWVSWAK
jgi:hypothetical protein